MRNLPCSDAASQLVGRLLYRQPKGYTRTPEFVIPNGTIVRNLLCSEVILLQGATVDTGHVPEYL